MRQQKREERRQHGGTYYKVQWYDEHNLAWMDVQKAHYEEADAIAAARALSKPKVRLMLVTPKGRYPQPPLDLQPTL